MCTSLRRRPVRLVEWGLSAALAALVLCGCAEPPDVARYQFDRGLAFYQNGEYQLAITAYTEAIEQQPEFADAFYERGLCHVQTDNLDAAIADYTQAIRLRPDFQQAYNNRAVAYAQQEAYDKAIEDCTKAIQLNPNDELAYRNRALAYHDKGQFDKAVEDSTTAIRLNPASAEAYLNRGNAWLDKGGYEEAIADFSEAVLLDVDLSKAYFSRAVAHEKRGETTQAADDFRKAKQLNAAFDIPREYLALVDPDAPSASNLGERPGVQPSGESEETAIERRAIGIAAEQYRSEGYEVTDTSATHSFELECRKAGQAVCVVVKGDAGDGHTIRMTREELRRVLDSQVPVDLFVVAQIEVDSGAGDITARSGHVAHHLRNWRPDESEMEPVTFELRLPSP